MSAVSRFEFEVLAPGEIPEHFGFDETYPPDASDIECYAVTEWTVRLPHQCDHWQIAGADNKASAVASLEAFIEEAQEALAQLKAKP